MKVPPFATDEEREGVLAMVRAAQDAGAAGITCANTVPVQDPRMSTGRGGLSGAPLLAGSNRVIRLLRAELGRAFPIIGSGGVMNAADARSKIKAGADLVQIYTGLIYEGPGVVGRIAAGLLEPGD